VKIELLARRGAGAPPQISSSRATVSGPSGLFGRAIHEKDERHKTFVRVRRALAGPPGSPPFLRASKSSAIMAGGTKAPAPITSEVHPGCCRFPPSRVVKKDGAPLLYSTTWGMNRISLSDLYSLLPEAKVTGPISPCRAGPGPTALDSQEDQANPQSTAIEFRATTKRPLDQGAGSVHEKIGCRLELCLEPNNHRHRFHWSGPGWVTNDHSNPEHKQRCCAQAEAEDARPWTQPRALKTPNSIWAIKNRDSAPPFNRAGFSLSFRTRGNA